MKISKVPGDLGKRSFKRSDKEEKRASTNRKCTWTGRVSSIVEEEVFRAEEGIFISVNNSQARRPGILHVESASGVGQPCQIEGTKTRESSRYTVMILWCLCAAICK